MSKKVISFDIETTGLDPMGKFNKKKFKKEGECRITVIGIFSSGEQQVFYDESETACLKQFMEFVEHNKDAIWTGYNIIGFDIPFILWRCVKCKINIAGSHLLNLKYGTSKWHNPYIFDTCIPFQEGWKKLRTLQHVLQFLGLPLKTDDGANAPELWKQGKIDELKEYVANDAKVEYLLYRWCESNGLMRNY